MILHASYIPSFVIASVLIATWASYVALETVPRISVHRGLRRAIWIGISAFCLGGGIWSMHFVAMLAYDAPVAISYDPAVTGLSLVLPIVTAAIGFAYLQREADLRWGPSIAVGSLLGIAIVAMHYTGMEAMRMQGVMEFDFTIVLLSFAIAVSASIVALRMSFHHSGPAKRGIGAVLMGIAISGMHYTGMYAMTMRAGMSQMGIGAAIDRTSLGLGVTVITALILSTGWIAAIYDRTMSGGAGSVE